ASSHRAAGRRRSASAPDTPQRTVPAPDTGFPPDAAALQRREPATAVAAARPSYTPPGYTALADHSHRVAVAAPATDARRGSATDRAEPAPTRPEHREPAPHALPGLARHLCAHAPDRHCPPAE